MKGKPLRADQGSESVLLEISQPYSNHNGGQLAFGPDGYLYIGTGDGGSGGDPKGYAQNRKSLLGKMLRIDVDRRSAIKNYHIPKDNPFIGNKQGTREEIYAWGLRNPWRYSFDRQTGQLWLADVGQNRFEEIHIVEKGKNYGWNTMEGKHCFKPKKDCSREGLEIPLHEYSHKLGKSITGGHVFRGEGLPKLKGAYIFGDFVTGRIWKLRKKGKKYRAKELLKTKLNISSFGVDEQKNLYLCSYYDGKIYTFVP